MKTCLAKKEQSMLTNRRKLDIRKKVYWPLLTARYLADADKTQNIVGSIRFLLCEKIEGKDLWK